MVFEGFPRLVLCGSMAVLNCRTLTECGFLAQVGCLPKHHAGEHSTSSWWCLWVWQGRYAHLFQAGGSVPTRSLTPELASRWPLKQRRPIGTVHRAAAPATWLPPATLLLTYSRLHTCSSRCRMLGTSSLLCLSSSCSLLWSQLKHTPSKEPFFLLSFPSDSHPLIYFQSRIFLDPCNDQLLIKGVIIFQGVFLTRL